MFLPNSSCSPARHDPAVSTRSEDVLKEIPISPEKSSQLPPTAAKRGFALLGGFQQRLQPEFGKGCPLQRGSSGGKQ